MRRSAGPAPINERGGRDGLRRDNASGCGRRQEHDERPAQELPEIKRLDLSEVVLTLKAAGIDDLRKFRWLEAPSERALSSRRGAAFGSGALEALVNGSITALGRRMLAFPVHPRYARMLLAAQEYGCVYHACLVAALTQGRDLLVRKPDREASHSRAKISSATIASSDFLDSDSRLGITRQATSFGWMPCAGTASTA